jgi:hypothetical protein
MSKYSALIKQATGCDDAEARRIEDFMRNTIFHSTLDWQTREELADAARLAHETLRFQQESEG